MKPGDDYVSRIFVRNPAESAVEDVTVTLTAPARHVDHRRAQRRGQHLRRCPAAP